MGPQKFIVILVCAITLSACQNEVELPEDIKKLDFSSQGITEIVDFSGFSELEEIDYSNNDLIEINPSAFEQNAKLNHINLSGNRKLSLPENGPFLITSAKMLNLSSCNIVKIPGNALDEMKKLEILDLTNNPIDFEDSLAFNNMEFPPRRMIVSEISATDLHFVCRHVDMTVVVKRENGKEYECKDVRKGNGESVKSQNMEMASPEDDNVEVNIIDENLMKVGTHMEMMSDQPDEGSGDDTVVIPEEEETSKGEVTSKEDDEATVSALDATEDTTEDTEIKPVIVDGTGAHDEILNHENENAEDHEKEIVEEHEKENAEEHEKENAEDDVEEKTEAPVTKKAGKGRSKIAPILDAEKVEVPAIARGLPVETIVTDNEVDFNKTGDNMKAADPAVGETLEDPTSATSSIVLVLIIAVVVVGSALVGFKYYKSRKPSYAVVNGVKDDPSEGKELKEIITQKQESQPLMEPRSDVQFEEVNEKTEPSEKEETTAQNNVSGEDTKDEASKKTISSEKTVSAVATPKSDDASKSDTL